MASTILNIDHHVRTQNLYPWMSLVGLPIGSPKNKTKPTLILTQFRLHPLLMTQFHYLYGTAPRHYLRHSVIMRIQTRRSSPCLPMGTCLLARRNWTTTTVGQGAASVLSCDLCWVVFSFFSCLLVFSFAPFDIGGLTHSSNQSHLYILTSPLLMRPLLAYGLVLIFILSCSLCIYNTFRFTSLLHHPLPHTGLYSICPCLLTALTDTLCQTSNLHSGLPHCNVIQYTTTSCCFLAVDFRHRQISVVLGLMVCLLCPTVLGDFMSNSSSEQLVLVHFHLVRRKFNANRIPTAFSPSTVEPRELMHDLVTPP